MWMPWLPTRSIRPCRTSTVARASSRARWVGVVDAPNSRASAESFTLGASSGSARGGRASPCTAPGAAASRAPRAGRAARRNPMSNPALWATSTAPRENSRNAGSTESIRRRVTDHRRGDAGELDDLRRDGAAGIDEGGQLAEHLAAADLHRTDLGDGVVAVARCLRGGAPTGGLQVHHHEGGVGEERAASGSTAAPKLKASCSASAIVRWPMAMTVGTAPDKHRQARRHARPCRFSLQSAPLLVGFAQSARSLSGLAPIRSAPCRYPAIRCAQHRTRGRST